MGQQWQRRPGWQWCKEPDAVGGSPLYRACTNPLKRGAPQASTPVLMEAPWKRFEDGTDVWYFNEETKGTSGTLP